MLGEEMLLRIGGSVFPVEVDLCDALGGAERGLDGIGEPLTVVVTHDETIDYDGDVVVLPTRKRRRVLQLDQLAVDTRANETLPPHVLEQIPELTLPPADERRKHLDP